MIATPAGTNETVFVGAGRSLAAALSWIAQKVASIFVPLNYARVDFDKKFIRANESPRSRLRSQRRARKKTTESHS